MNPPPAAAGGSALGRCVGDADGFLDRCFGEVPHRWHGGAFDDLLSLDHVDALLTSAGLRRPAVRLVRDGATLDPATWTRRARTGSTWVDDLVHPGKVLDHFAAGATVVLQGLHRWLPALTELCRALELELGHAVQANAYLTPPGAAGLAAHHDTHDVFVLQVDGVKDWVVREPVVRAPLPQERSDHGRAAQQPVLFEARLEPGDCLYLPRGFVHSARTQDGVSLHVTLGVLAPTAQDLLRRLADSAATDPRFRRPLPAGFGTDAAVAERAVKDLAAAFAQWLGELDPAPVAAEVVDRFARNRPPLLRGQLSELAALGEVDDDTVVAVRAGLVWRVAVEGDVAVVTTGDRRLAVPSVLEPALRRLLGPGGTRVGALADLLDGPSRLVLVRRLIREGLLVRERRAPGG